MFVVIFVTNLITIIVLAITSACYLISLICDESDDVGSPDALAVDTSDFSSTPAISPLEPLNQPVCDTVNDNSNERRPSAIPDTALDTEELEKELRLVEELPFLSNQSPSRESQSIMSSDNFSDVSSPPLPPSSLTRTAWKVPYSVQKNIIISHLGAPTSKLIFEDFDQKEVQLGGTGLHWCKTRKYLDKLIKIGVPIDEVNEQEETALHVAIRRHKLQILIGLLCHEADVESRNNRGETPLILASKVNDIFACQLLLVYDANYDAVDKLGKSARHYAARICDKHKVQQQLPSAAHLILAMLNEIGAKRCSENPLVDKSDPKSRIHCTDGCSYNGNYDGNSYNRWPNFSKESLYKRHMFTDIIEAHKRGESREDQNDDHRCSLSSSDRPKRSKLLCIDGGGMRGVIVCQIMIEMEKHLKKPWVSYFDWIGGTSVGAFLACALCNGTSLKELRKISFDVKDEVFSGNRPYNSKFLEQVLKRTYGTTTRLSSFKNKKLAVTTVIADRDPCQLRLFRNYKSPSDILRRYGFPPENYDNMSGHSVVVRRQIHSSVLDEKDHDPLVWQAVRASAAAPFYFKPYGPYLDGGIISNNPTMDMLAEFHSYERVKRFLRSRVGQDSSLMSWDEEIKVHEEQLCELGLVVSLGTGRGRVIGRQAMIDVGQVASGFSTVFSPVELLKSIRAARDLFKKLMQQSCQTEDHILDRAQGWCSSLNIPYFRINPPLATIFSMDDKRDEQLINALWQTKLYMREMSPQLRELSEILDARSDDDDLLESLTKVNKQIVEKKE